MFGYVLLACCKFDGGQVHMNSARKDHLKVPGASLFYEIRGSGPVFLVIPGGPADASVFSGIAPRLSDRYTVVTVFGL